MTKSQLTELRPTGGSLIALAGTAIRWANTPCERVGDIVCANGLPTSGVSAIASGVSVLGTSAFVVLAHAPASVKDETNVKAGISTGKGWRRSARSHDHGDQMKSQSQLPLS